MNFKKFGKILSWVIIVLVLLAAIGAITVSIIMPNSEFASWVATYIWDFQDFKNNIVSNASTLFSRLITIVVIYAIGKFVRAIFKSIMKKSDRAKTVLTLIDGFVKYATAFAIIFVTLNMFGVDTAALWASAGILTLVIGLGCQTLINDIVAGLFIIFENNYNVGEIIVVDGFRGTVQEIGIRSTKILDAAGDIKIINNADVKNVVNLSRELSLAVCDCGIEYSDSIERIELVIAKNLDRIKENIPQIVDGPYYKGVSVLGDSSVVIKLVAQCKEDDRYQVQRDLNREVKLMFDRNNINIPFPQIVINQPIKLSNEATNIEKLKAKNFVNKQKELSQELEDQEDI